MVLCYSFFFFCFSLIEMSMHGKICYCSLLPHTIISVIFCCCCLYWDLYVNRLLLFEIQNQRMNVEPFFFPVSFSPPNILIFLFAYFNFQYQALNKQNKKLYTSTQQKWKKKMFVGKTIKTKRKELIATKKNGK